MIEVQGNFPLELRRIIQTAVNAESNIAQTLCDCHLRLSAPSIVSG